MNVYASADKLKLLRFSFPAVCFAIEQKWDVRVQEYLGVTDVVDAPLAILDLSVRANHCLIRENVHTVKETLQMPLVNLATMRNAGNKTIKEILDSLKDYVDNSSFAEGEDGGKDKQSNTYVSTEKSSFDTLKPFCDLIIREEWGAIEARLDRQEDLDELNSLIRIAETIGPEMVVAALTTPNVVAKLFDSFKDYLNKQKICNRRRTQVKKLIDALPAGRAKLLVLPFLDVWSGSISYGNIRECIGVDTRFSDLETIAVQVDEKVFDKLLSFLSWCKIDIKTEISNALRHCIRNLRQEEVLKMRSEGGTLDAIGVTYGITRERVRQIEAKVLRLFGDNDANRILHLISAERGGDNVLTADEIREFCADSADIVLHLLRSTENTRNYRYIKHLDSFVLNESKLGEEHVQAYIDDLPDRIEADELNGVLEKACAMGFNSERIELQIRSDYHYVESIRVWQRGKLNIREMCKQVLATYDPDGLYIYSVEELSGFRERLAEMFGSEARISEGDRALTSIIRAVGMLRNRGTYVSIKDDLLSDNLMSRIKEYIETGSSEVYMYSTIFDAFKEELCAANVDNRYYLQGILRREWDGIYAFSRDCLSKGERTTNIYGVIEEFVKNTGGYVNSAEIREAFPGVADSVINFALSRGNVIACNGKYIHTNNLCLDDEMKQSLHSMLDSMLADGHAHHGRELYSQAKAFAVDKLDDIGITNKSALFSVAVCFFGEEYAFSRPWIAKKGSVGEEEIRDLRNRSFDDEEDDFSEDAESVEGTTTQIGTLIPLMVSGEVASRWNQILVEEFEDGLRLNGMRLRKFRGIYEERFQEQLEADDEKLVELLKQACDYRDERIYAKQDVSQSTLLQTIHGEIISLLSSGATGVYPQQLFEKYQVQLGEQLSVYTVDGLKSMLQPLQKRHYSKMYGVFCLPGKACNPRTDVLKLFQNCYEPLTYTQMSEQLWYIPLDKIKHELVMESSIVNIDQETYFYAPNFPISTHELAALQRAMQRRIEDEGYLVAKELRELMQLNCPNAVMDTATWKDWGIRNAMAWLLRDRFEFNGIVVCAKSAGLDTHKVFRLFCSTRSHATLDEIKTLCTKLDVSGIYWDSVFDEMVRISKTEFVAKDSIHFDVEATDRALENACCGDYMSLKDFVLFMTLPGVEFPWNGYLLESYLRTYSRTFCLNQAGPTEHTFMGAMVKRKSAFTTHRELLTDVLAHDDTWETEKEAFVVLREGGYRSYSAMTNSAEMIKAARELREKLKSGKK